MFNILPGAVNTMREAASRAREMPNIVMSNPTDDSFEKILNQADYHIQGMSIAGPK